MGEKQPEANVTAITKIYASLAVSFCVAAQEALKQAVNSDYDHRVTLWRDAADHFSQRAQEYTKLAVKYDGANSTPAD